MNDVSEIIFILCFGLILMYVWILITIGSSKIMVKEFTRLFLFIKHVSRQLLKFFTPKNIGVKRLCLVVGLLVCAIFLLIDWCNRGTCYLLTDFEPWEAILYLALAFCTPFILSKIIEYIADGFRQGQEIL